MQKKDSVIVTKTFTDVWSKQPNRTLYGYNYFEDESGEWIYNIDFHVDGCFAPIQMKFPKRISLEGRIDKIMDDRNYEITNKLNDVLNNVKGFDAAMSNPRQGKMLVRYNGISFYITIEPVFNDNTEGKKADIKPFDEVVKTHNWIWK